MATKSSTDALAKLEEQLTCPICLEGFVDPKFLPCFHSFCLHCLERVPIELVNSSQYLPCPTCRSSCPVPDKGLATLPSSFVINNLIEVHDLMKKVSGDQHTVSCDNCNKTNASHYCKQCAKFSCPDCLHHHDSWRPNAGHETITLGEVASTAHQLLRTRPEDITNCTDHSKPQEIFCETCQELVCQLCTVKKHKDHEYDVVCDVYERYRDAINRSSLQPLNQEFDRLAQDKTTLVNEIDKVNRQAKTTNSEIDHTITKIKERLDATGRQMKDTVIRAWKLKVGVLERQLNELNITMDKVRESRDHVEQSMEVGTPHQLVRSKAWLLKHSADVIGTTGKKTFQPLEQADIELVENVEISNTHCNVGEITYTLSAKVQLVSKNTPLLSQESTITVSLLLPDGSPAPVPSSLIKCRLTPPTNHGCHPTECTVKGSSQSGHYSIVFTPVTRGRHQLHITIHDREVAGSPVSVAVTLPPEMMTEPVKTIAIFEKPRGIAVSDDGLVVVSESGRCCITILDKEGNKVRSFSSRGSRVGQLDSPRGVAISLKGTILVADIDNHRIQEFTMEGKCVSCVGSKGNGPLQFHYPYGIAVSKMTGQVFVTEVNNHRVQVLDPDLTFSHMWGKKGSEGGQFNHPNDVTVDNQGFVYVTDRNNCCVQKFTTKGQFVSLVKYKSIKGLNQSAEPSGITIDTSNNLLYINNTYDDRCSVFTTDLQFICFIKKWYIGSSYSFQGAFYDTHSGYGLCCHSW